MKNRLNKDFILTTKWSQRIKGWAKDYKMPEDDAVQEAYFIEWRQRQKVFQSAEHCENYFLRSVKNKIITHGKTWWETKRYRNPKKTDLELIDSLIEMRSFDELFYKYLIDNITFLLAEINNISAELFTMRITTQKRWNAIHKEYPDIKYFAFYQHIGRIKKIVKQEVCRAINE